VIKEEEVEALDLRKLRKAIPRDCFQSSTIRSLAYVLRDFAYAGLLLFSATKIDFIESRGLRVLAWFTYGLLQGFVGTGIWILGHECGHGAFSPSTVLNDVLGWLLHSVLLVPYFSWKITHARHHRYTGHMGRDMVFVPSIKPKAEQHRRTITSKIQQVLEDFEDIPIYSALHLLGHQLLGWQLYLTFNLTSGKESLPAHSGQRKWLPNQSHFDPWSSLFTASQRPLILISDFGLALTGACLFYCGRRVGFWRLVLTYFVPYLWVHHWLGKLQI